MEWGRAVDGYCERLDPSFWAEPVNALTNAAFLLAALAMWRRTGGMALPRLLSALLFAIGIGSFLLHTYATAWAGLADVLPILLFVLTYTFAANRHFWRLSPLWSALGAVLVIPWLALLTPLFRLVPGLSTSAMYWPIPLLIALYAVALRRRLPGVARGQAIGAALLCLSLAARSLDTALCPVLPLGTHWLWHLLNALMLGWMIEVLRRHMLEAARPLG
ncbi:hypothetical protein [Oceaniglobus roseus]|uniref:hypothetical protein n=1 Tax=Oceaniglobus roseus TaxID=1737570 RepID=UPI000C7EF87F|nr:hypothetical protein [Kandeliimicrobium roseum]